MVRPFKAEVFGIEPGKFMGQNRANRIVLVLGLREFELERRRDCFEINLPCPLFMAWIAQDAVLLKGLVGAKFVYLGESI